MPRPERRGGIDGFLPPADRVPGTTSRWMSVVTATAMGLAQRKAGETYSAVTSGLLPLLLEAADRDEHSAVGARLDAVAVQIRRYAPLWSEHGEMLRAAMGSAVRLHLQNDRVGLVAILRLVAARLFLLSASPRPPQHVGHHNERAWTRRFTL